MVIFVSGTCVLNVLVFIFYFSGIPRKLNIKLKNYLCTYHLYSPVDIVLDACISITWGSGRGLGPGILEFFGPCEMGMSR